MDHFYIRHGRINEPEMVEQMWPGGKQPVTDKPYFIINSAEDRASKNYLTGGTYTSPMTSLLLSEHGASIVYTFEKRKNPTGCFIQDTEHEPGDTRIRVKAVRYGYRESEELTGTFEIK